MNTYSGLEEFDEVLVHLLERTPGGLDFAITMKLADGRDASGQLSLASDTLDLPTAGSAEEIATYGVSLFNRLFNGQLSAAFHQAWAASQARQRRIRLKLRLDGSNPQLHRVPWEVMYFDDGSGSSPPRPLATDTNIAFSRYLPSGEAAGEPVERSPLRMLMAISAPNDLGDVWPLTPIDRDAERRDLLNRFSPMASAGQVRFDVLERVSAERLFTALDQGVLPDAPGADGLGYDVLFYYGHALHHPVLGSRLLLEDDKTGKGRLLDGVELVERLAQLRSDTNHLSLIILISCNTATQTNTPRLGSLADQLLTQAGVPAVLAMQDLVSIPLARSFAYYMGEYLLRDGVVDVAVNAARRMVRQSDSVSWSIPVLYMRSQDGRLFAPNARIEYTKRLQADPLLLRWSGNDFIPVEAIEVPTGQSWAVIAARPDDAPPPADALSLLHRYLRMPTVAPPLLAIIGPPQSGQTTTLRRLAWELADAVRKDQDLDSPVGIYVQLGAYEQQPSIGNRLERLIINAVNDLTPALGAQLRQLFDQPASDAKLVCIFLLDGLDQVPESLRYTLTEELRSLMERLPAQRFVISCTQTLFPLRLTQSARVLLLQPLSERQVLRYLRQRDPNQSNRIFRRIGENRLLDVTSDPTLLTLIYERFAQDQRATLTRNQILQEILDSKISAMKLHANQGDAVHETLVALAWELHWNYRDALSLNEVFTLMARVRGERDYSLETLFQAMVEERLLMDSGRNMIRFVQPIVQSYCCAIALNGRADFDERLVDITAMCGVSARLSWWEETLYALSGLLISPQALLAIGRWALPENSGPHTFLLARCLESLSPEVQQRISSVRLNELIDACTLRLRPEREPSPVRRAQIASALGRLAFPQAANELKRLLTDKVRPTRSGARYDYTNVRIAAARGLRNLLARQTVVSSLPEPVAAQGLDRSGARDLPEDAAQSSAPLSDNSALAVKLEQLFRDWIGDDSTDVYNIKGRDTLRTILRSAEASTPERAVAAFALGDLALDATDAQFLIDTIVSPPPAGVHPEEWKDTIWAATDALTLFEAAQVAQLVATIIDQHPQLDEMNIEQLTYLAGRIRVAKPTVVQWIYTILCTQHDYNIKGKALQSLAWIGRVIDRIPLPGTGRWMGDVLRDMVIFLATWQGDPATKPEALGDLLLDSLSPDSGEVLYLRRKAIEAFPWIGNQALMESLTPQIAQWPIELREAWYLSLNIVQMRSQRNG